MCERFDACRDLYTGTRYAQVSDISDVVLERNVRILMDYINERQSLMRRLSFAERVLDCYWAWSLELESRAVAV